MLKDFSNADFIAWTRDNIPGKGKLKNDMINKIEETELSGSHLEEVQNPEDFVELGITNIMARKLFKKLKATFPTQFAVTTSNTNNTIDTNNTNNMNNNLGSIDLANYTVADQNKKLSNTNDSIDALLERNKLELANRQKQQQQVQTKQQQQQQEQTQQKVNTSDRGKFSFIRRTNSWFVFGSLSSNDNNNISINSNNKSFKVSVFVGNKRKLTHNTFTINNTILDLKKEIAQNESGGNPEGCDVRLAYNGKPLTDGKTLGQCGITNSSCFVTAIIRLIGGALAAAAAAVVSDEKDEKKSNVNVKVNSSGGKLLDNGKNSDTRVRLGHFHENKNIKASLEPDCVTLEDSQNELRVQMPCGHVFSPLTIFKWCQRTLEVYSKSEVCCPMLICNKKWEIKDIVSGGDLDEDEHGSLVNILSHRQLMSSGDYKECPECNALVELPDTVYICRVRCTSLECKKKGDFCWLCNKSWKSSGMSVCGNKDCHSHYVNESLKIKNCGTIDEVMGRKDINKKCPKLRACPRCLSITEYKKDCKHMVCWNCRRSFCFVCLSLAGKEIDGSGKEWACEGGDNYAGKCKLADVQVLE